MLRQHRKESKTISFTLSCNTLDNASPEVRDKFQSLTLGTYSAEEEKGREVLTGCATVQQEAERKTNPESW